MTDLTTRAVLEHLAVVNPGAQPVTLLFALDRRRLLVALTARGEVTVHDPLTRAERRFQVVKGGDGLGWPPVTVHAAK